jgi:hypothetical protein
MSIVEIARGMTFVSPFLIRNEIWGKWVYWNVYRLLLRRIALFSRLHHGLDVYLWSRHVTATVESPRNQVVFEMLQKLNLWIAHLSCLRCAPVEPPSNCSCAIEELRPHCAHHQKCPFKYHDKSSAFRFPHH